jgi:hypothetical protein
MAMHLTLCSRTRLAAAEWLPPGSTRKARQGKAFGQMALEMIMRAPVALLADIERT